MPPVTIKGRRRWDVDGGGVACHIVPGLDGNIVTQMPSAAVDGEILKQTRELDRLTAERDEIQVKIDEAQGYVTDMTAFRATVTAEPA
jgi:hypothetical protein